MLDTALTQRHVRAEELKRQMSGGKKRQVEQQSVDAENDLLYIYNFLDCI